METSEIRDAVIECLKKKFEVMKAENLDGFNFCAADLELKIDGALRGYRIVVLSNVDGNAK